MTPDKGLWLDQITLDSAEIGGGALIEFTGWEADDKHPDAHVVITNCIITRTGTGIRIEAMKR